MTDTSRARIVKPLEWIKVVDTRRGSFERRKWDATSDFGVIYSIWDYDFVNWRGGAPASNADTAEERYSLNMDGGSRLHQSHHPSLDAAKATAQSDYERRILAALDPDFLTRAETAEARLAEAVEELLCAKDYVSDTANGHVWTESTKDGRSILEKFQDMVKEDLERMTPRIAALRATLAKIKGETNAV